MLDILTVRNNIETIGKDFSEEMMEMAKVGNIDYFRNTLDKLTEDEYYDLDLIFYHEIYNFSTILKVENSIVEIITTLIYKGIDNFDEDIIKYVINENKAFILNRYRFQNYFKKIIIDCLDKSMFDFAYLLLESLPSKNFMDFIDIFKIYVKYESLSKIQFFIDNFEIKPEFILYFIIASIMNRNVFSLRLMLGHYRKQNYENIENGKDRFISVLLEEISKNNTITDEIKNLTTEFINVIWDQIIEDANCV